MRTALLPLLCFISVITCLVSAPSSAQEVLPEVERPLPVCEIKGPVPVMIEAAEIELVGPLVRAAGRVFFLRGNYRIRSSEATYNLDTSVGTVRNVVFTTCSAAKPDYRIEAREITLLPNNKIHAKGVSLYLGSFKVLSLPSMVLRIGGRAGSRAVFPRPGYDDRDGFTLSQTLRLTDTNRARTYVNVRLTTRHSIQGEIGSTYGVGGYLVSLPGRFFTYQSMRVSGLNLPEPPAGPECNPQDLRPVNPARLRAFGIFTVRQRTFDVQNEGLVVNRQPEIGLTYIGRQLNLSRQRLDPRIEIYPQLAASWGRFEEIPSTVGFETRTMLDAVAPVNLLPLGQSTTVQPAGFYRLAKYGNGDTYRAWAYALDVSHLFPNGTYLSGRYVRWFESGATPFEFDNLDVKREVQGAAQIWLKRHVVAAVFNYDLDARDLYEWEALYGYRTDCLGVSFRWNNRLHRFSFDIALLNL